MEEQEAQIPCMSIHGALLQTNVILILRLACIYIHNGLMATIVYNFSQKNTTFVANFILIRSQVILIFHTQFSTVQNLKIRIGYKNGRTKIIDPGDDLCRLFQLFFNKLYTAVQN